MQLVRVLRVVIPLAVSVSLVAWLFHEVDFEQVRHILGSGVDYRYIVLMMLITMLSHIIRGIRWGIQLRAAGIPRIPVIAESVSIFGAYALNLVFPYLGEAWRCVYISRRENCKLSTVVGTDLGDRGSDAVVVLMLLGLALAVAHPAIESFVDRYPLGEAIGRLFTDGAMWVWIVGVVAALAVCDRIWRHTGFVEGVNASIVRIWRGFSVLFHMRGTGWYIVLTFGIWGCYFLETYVCFYAFPFTRQLIHQAGSVYGLIPGLVVFVFGSFSMAVPTNGGLGAWNIAVMFALTLFDVSQADGAAYSLLCWSAQAVMLILLGLFSAAYIMSDRRRARSQKL